MKNLKNKWFILFLLGTILFSSFAMTGCQTASHEKKKNDLTLQEFLSADKPK